MSHRLCPLARAVLVCSAGLISSAPVWAQNGDHRATVLEEVIVTAQKRAESLQDTPIAISALSSDQLEQQGIFSLEDFSRGTVPTLKVQPFPNNPSTLIIAMRGIGPADIGQPTREAAVGVYVDNIYLGRAQGLAAELADIERVEVLRGPQGTLFGRNTVGGAVSFTTRKPSGEFGFSQTLSYGDYDYFKSLTRIDLPAIAGFSAKIDYLKSERDGWVENSEPDSHDYNEFDKEGGRLSLRWQPVDRWTFDYAYDNSTVEATQNYYQFENDTSGEIFSAIAGVPIPDLVGNEPGRREDTRFPVPFNEPSETDQEGHSLAIAWDVSELLTIKSISSYRELDEKTNGNYAGAFLVGLIIDNKIDQEQWSQEFQFVGSTENGQLKYVAGLYYFEEEVEDFSRNIGWLIPDPGNTIPGLPFYGGTLFKRSPLPFPDPLGVNMGISDARLVKAESESRAVYGQLTWTPPARSLENRLNITVGFRYTEDEKNGSRPLFRGQPTTASFDLETDHFDPTLTLNWEWSDGISNYFRWASGYKAAGVNLRSSSFATFDEEVAEVIELGLKSEFWGRRIRLNAAVFSTEYKDLQLDFSDPANITVSETINAANGEAEVDGLEFEMTILPAPGLMLGINYTYLDWELNDQFNPLSGRFERFVLPQAPEHAGSLTVDYTFAPLPFGSLTLHADVTSTDKYFYTPQNYNDADSYTLFNARITLSDIPLGMERGALKVALWGRNLSDEEYIQYTPAPSPFTVAYGDPRMVGIDVTFEY